MSYVAQNFEDGKVLKAEHLNYIERNLVSIAKNSDKVPGKANAFVTETSGDAVTFYPDEGSPLGVTAHIEPVQAGGGDPYPAGGGKNLLGSYSNAYYTGTRNGLEVTPQADGTLKITGTPTMQWNNLYEEVPCNIPAGEYVYSYETDLPNTVTIGLALKYSNGTYVDLKTLGSKATLTENVMGCKVYLERTDTTKNYNNTLRLQLEKGSTPTPYAPYSNIRPISGHTGCDVTRCGKNLVNATRKGETIGGSVVVTKNENGYYTLNGTAASNAVLVVCEMLLPAGTYTLSHAVESGSTDNTGNAVAQLVAKETNTILAFTRANIQSVTYTLEADTNVTIRLYASSGRTYNNWKIAAQLEKGTTATPYEPYQGANTYVMDFGKNLLKNTATTKTENGVTFTVNADGSVTVNGTATATAFCAIGSVDFKANTKYVLTAGISVNGAYVKIDTVNVIASSGIAEYTPSSDATYSVTLRVGGGTTLTNVTFYPMIRLASDPDSTYAPYNGAILAQTGGMVYGGTLDWNTGVLKVDRAIATLTGNESWVASSSNANAYYVSSIDNPGVFPGTATLDDFRERTYHSCSHYKATLYTDVMANNECNGYAGAGQSGIVGASFRFKDARIANVSDWKSYLAAQKAAGTPVQVCYKLATPTTIQLTPQEIVALKGGNTVYTNAGSVTVEYNKSLSKAFEEVLAKLAAIEAAVVNNV